MTRWNFLQGEGVTVVRLLPCTSWRPVLRVESGQKVSNGGPTIWYDEPSFVRLPLTSNGVDQLNYGRLRGL